MKSLILAAAFVLVTSTASFGQWVTYYPPGPVVYGPAVVAPRRARVYYPPAVVAPVYPAPAVTYYPTYPAPVYYRVGPRRTVVRYAW